MNQLADLLKRAQVLATSAIAWLSAISAILVVLAQQLEGVAGVPEWLTRTLASTIAVIGVIILQVRRVTPVDDSDKGLLPPKGPAVPAGAAALDVQPVDRGDITLSMLFLVIALVLFLIVGAIGAGWITSDNVFAFLGFGLASWVLAALIP